MQEEITETAPETAPAEVIVAGLEAATTAELGATTAAIAS